MRGQRGIEINALGRSRGGFSTKLHAVVDARGQPLHIELSGGQQHEATRAQSLVAKAQGRCCIADAGYDADRIIAAIKARGMKAVIAPGGSRKGWRRRYDKKSYSVRFRVEIFFHHLKRCRRIATRYEKTARNYLALVHLACALLWVS